MRSLLLLAFLATSSLSAETLITWKTQQLHGDFYSEGAGIGDINGDGKPDVVAGPFWWEGPAFEKKHAYYEPKIFNINGYSDNFFAYVYDFNGDKKNDILILGFPGKEARLYLNPCTTDDKPWSVSVVADVVDNESPVFTDITGDGKPEIVCGSGGSYGWFSPDWAKPTEKWKFTPLAISPKVQKFTHGMGVGDVNGDGRLDLLSASQWFEQPDPKAKMPIISEIPRLKQLFERKDGGVFFGVHSFPAGGGGAQMFAYDFDGDGLNDVATTLRAHDYGVAVFLQNKPQPRPTANTPDTNTIPPEIPWTKRLIAGEHPTETDYGIVFSQPHAMHLADINDDGIKDLVVGKRYWAHNGHGPDEHTPLALYWYETRRTAGKVDFIPHQIDTEKGVGVGTDVQVGDVNGDGLPDVVVANKAGVFIVTQERKQITAAEARIMEPKKMYGPALKPQAEYAHGQSPQDALKALQLPGGFKADLIAAEPDIVQPIAFTFDECGRIWVVEGLSYPQPRAPGAGKDRIIILEDKDGDGTFETRKVFCEGISLASGIELGFGGVWVGASPYMMFIPRADDSTIPLNQPHLPSQTYASYAQVPGLNFTAYALLDGFGSQDTHETLNSFIWGPDGWLYGCHGVFTHSLVGKPGTPDAERTPINAGVWRYHPVRHAFEVFAQGTSNPWGLDYDRNGEFFATACVIPHLYHIVPGARYVRQGGQHFNPYTYDSIVTIADHAHYAGDIRNNAHWGGRDGGDTVQDDTNAVGGGHAHCGLAIYQSSLFPQTYRNSLIFGNLHGHRLVSDYIEPKGSTYAGKHGSDFMRSNDMNFIPVTQKVGPDGALYVSDWSDKQVCHRGSNAVELWDRSNGRIYRVSYAGWKPWKSDLGEESDESLAKMAVQTENEWLSRMARRVLMEREANKSLKTDGVLRAIAGTDNLKALWLRNLVSASAYYLNKEATKEPLPIRELAALQSNDEHIRAAAIRMLSFMPLALSESKDVAADSLATRAAEFAKMAKSDSSPNVRRELASALQRLPDSLRIPVARTLLSHAQDKDDPYIPLLIWYGIEPVVGADAKAALELAKASKFPKITEFIYRRMGADGGGRMALIDLAAEAKDSATRDVLLDTVLQAARAGNKIGMPEKWPALKAKVVSTSVEAKGASTNPPAGSTKVEATLTELEAYMGVLEAKQAFRAQLSDASLPNTQRQAALALLLNTRDTESAATLVALVKSGDKGLTRDAVQALATLAHPDTAAVLIEKFATFDAPTQLGAVNTLATTSAGAKALLTAVKAKQVPATMISPFLARQLEALKNADVSALLKETFGDLNAPKPDLEERKKKFRKLLAPVLLAKADATKGHILFTAICGQCHKLFGEGQNVGPDLTGSNRATLDYLLDNVLDPNAVIGKAYQLNLFELNDGRVASGVIKEETPAAFRIAMPGGLEQTITASEVKKHTIAKVSTMPEGLFDALPPEQLQQLVAYLQTNASPAAPAGKGAAVATKVDGALEGEDLKIIDTHGGQTKVQGMRGFGSRWSNGAQLWWTGAKPGSTLTLALPVAEKGKYQLKGMLTKARDYGIIDIALDDKLVATAWDGYNSPAVVQSDELNWGTHELIPGDHKLTFTVTGANPQAVKAYMVGIDYVKLVK